MKLANCDIDARIQFWDSIRLRYDWPIPGLPISYWCGEGLNVQYAMSCRKGGFVTLRHNEVRHITTTLLSDICKDVKFEPSFLILNWEEQTVRKTAKTNDEVRFDICARSFWVISQKAFSDKGFRSKHSKVLKTDSEAMLFLERK